MEVLVRRAGVADAAAIAHVNTVSWQQGYAGLMPDDFLATLVVEEQLWTDRLTQAPASSAHFVAVVQERVVGFAGAGPALGADDPATTDLGQLYTLYVLAEHWGTGLGHRLHTAALQALRAGRFRSAMLWVLTTNRRAIDFYERQGWRAQDTWQQESLPGFAIRERLYDHDLRPAGERSQL